MITVLLLMGIGIALGFWLDKFPKMVQQIEKSISWAIYLLLFFLGVSVGTNQEILNNLQLIGWQAFVITAGAVAGSVTFSWALYHFLFKKTLENQEQT